MKRKNVPFSKRILVKAVRAYGKNGCRIDKKVVFRQEGCFVRQSFVIFHMKGGNLQLLYSRVSESRNGASERKFKFSKFFAQSH
jgi:hypothetical protein